MLRFREYAISGMNCQTILKRTEMLEMVETTGFFHFLKRKKSLLLYEKLCADDCSKQRTVREEGEAVGLGAGGSGKTG